MRNFGETHTFPFIHQVCLASFDNVRMLTGHLNLGDFIFFEHDFREKKKKSLKVQFFLEYHFRPDHSPPTITTTQKTYGKRKKDMLHLCMNLEQGERREGVWGQSPWGEYTMNHKNIVNVFDTNL